MGKPKLAKGLIWLAFSAGIVHAGFSLYWALGGTWLLNTVGQVATTITQRGARFTVLFLLGVALFKALAASFPVLNAYGTLPWSGLWRSISWIGGLLLILYGAVNTITAWLVLLGIIVPASYDRPALLGHAALWDPLFLIWGLGLTAYLWQTRKTNQKEIL